MGHLKINDRPQIVRPTAGNVALRDVVLPRDCEGVRAIVENTGFFRPDEVAIAVELVEEHLARGAASGYHFIFAELGDKLAGYACYGPIACTVGSYDLYWIAVAPSGQRHGIGRMLVEAVESQVVLNGGARIYIDTSGQAKYAPTRSFYERSGFRCDARLVDFYAEGDDRVIYVKTLNE